MGNMLNCCDDASDSPAVISNNTLCPMNNTDYLNNVEYDDTVIFIFPIKYGKVIKIYDGDTITIAAKFPNTEGPIYRFSVRLNGIDTPEIRGNTPNERELAKQAKNALQERLYGKIVELRNVSNEKYGRILADVYLDGENISQWLISQHLAVAYDGGKKHRPEHWD
jgi:micrococcal nuclease